MLAARTDFWQIYQSMLCTCALRLQNHARALAKHSAAPIAKARSIWAYREPSQIVYTMLNQQPGRPCAFVPSGGGGVAVLSYVLLGCLPKVLIPLRALGRTISSFAVCLGAEPCTMYMSAFLRRRVQQTRLSRCATLPAESFPLPASHQLHS